MIELVSLQFEDCEAVAQIAQESLPEHWSLAGIQDVLRYENNVYYTAKDVETQQVVGFAGIMVIAEEAELLNIAICREYRKQRIGQRLLDKVIWEARKRCAKRVLLEVRQSNCPARQFYCKNGFEELGIRKNYYNNPTEDAIIMEKLL